MLAVLLESYPNFELEMIFTYKDLREVSFREGRNLERSHRCDS